jgi:hypothetical protein
VIFLAATAGVFGLLWLTGERSPLSVLLGVWAGLFVAYTLFRFGYFAERAQLRLPGASGPSTEKMRRTSGKARLSPTAEARYLSVEEANREENEVQPEDRVIGIEAGGHAIAYPLAAMGVREVAHEVLDGQHVFVSWWPVTYSARAFVLDASERGEPSLTTLRKTILNSSVLLGPGGSQVVQFLGQVVTGPDAGTALRQVPVISTNWRAWSQAFPHTEVMSLEGTPDVDMFERYYITERAGLYQQSAKDRRWHDKDTVLGVEINGQAKAYPYPALIERPLLQEELGGEPVLIAHERISATAVAFCRRVDGQVLTFKGDSRNPRRPTAEPGETDIRRRIHYEPWFLLDDQTGSRWRAVSGECVSGKLKGSRLELLPGQTGFWFAWSRFYPNAQVMEPRPSGEDKSG